MRIALALSTLALGLIACAQEGEGKDSVPGHELEWAEKAETGAAKKPSVWDVTPSELLDLLETGHTVLIDVRTGAEVAEGVIPGALHIPMDEFDPATFEISPYMSVLFYCRSGRRSRIVAKKYSAHTGERESHLAGGIIAWREAGQETVLPAE